MRSSMQPRLTTPIRPARSLRFESLDQRIVLDGEPLGIAPAPFSFSTPTFSSQLESGPWVSTLSSEQITETMQHVEQAQAVYQQQYGQFAANLQPVLAQAWEAFKATLAENPDAQSAAFPVIISVEMENVAEASIALSQLGYAADFRVSSGGGYEASLEINLGSLDEILAINGVEFISSAKYSGTTRSLTPSGNTTPGEFNKACSPNLLAQHATKPSLESVDAVFAAPTALTRLLPSEPVIDVVAIATKPAVSSDSPNANARIAASSAFVSLFNATQVESPFAATTKKGKAR